MTKLKNRASRKYLGIDLDGFDMIALSVILFTILAPPIRITTSFPVMRLEEIVLFIIFPIAFLLEKKKTLHKRGFIRENLNIIMICFFIIVLAMTFSLFYGSLFLDVPITFGDLNEFLKPIKFAMTFLLFSQLTICKEKLDFFSKVILIGAMVSACIGFFQYFNLFNINDYISPLYTRTEHQLKALIKNGRVSSTFGNPIVYGGFMMVMTLFSLSILWGSVNKKLKRLAIIALPLFVISIVLTKSRAPIMLTGVSIIILFLVIQIFNKGNRKTKIRNLVIFLGLLLVAIGSFFLLSDKWALYRFQRLLENPSKDTSLMKRVGNWIDAYKYFLKSPVFGWGPATSKMTTWVENDYLFILRRYGLLGFIAFFTPLVLIFNKSIKFITAKINNGFSYMNYTIFTSTIALGGFMMILYFYHELQLSIIYWIFAGLLYSSCKSIEKNGVLNG